MAAESAKKENAFILFWKRFLKFIRDCKGEVKKVVWPTPKTVFRNMAVVLITILVLCLFIFVLDTVFMNLLGLFMEVSG